jgi:hypothetical protein
VQPRLAMRGYSLDSYLRNCLLLALLETQEGAGAHAGMLAGRAGAGARGRPLMVSPNALLFVPTALLTSHLPASPAIRTPTLLFAACLATAR